MIARTAMLIPIAWVVAACGGPAGAAQDSADVERIPIRAASVVEEELASRIVATGTLGPKEEVTLSFKIAGVIARVDVDAGETVRAGAVLAALDLREIEAAVTRAQSVATRADRDLARAQRLYADSVFTLAQLQDAETGAQVANADLDAARFNRRYAVISAPAGGVILRRLAEPGETVAAGAPVLVLGSDARGAVVRTGLADRDVVRVRVGDPAIVRFDALPDRALEGKVTEIAAAAEAATGTWAVEVSVPAVGHLSAGLVGTVEIRPTTRVRAAIIPIEAMLEADGDEATVFVLSADSTRVLRRRVTVAFITGDNVAIRRGLEGVAAVVTDGAAWLEDGAAVRVMR